MGTRADRFWPKVDQQSTPEGCWPWMASTQAATGYGQFYSDGQPRTAHSVAFRLAGGMLAPGEEVCHSCDNRCCCNPAHLFAGTRRVNMQDAKAKGRMSSGVSHSLACAKNRAVGERAGQAKLSSAQVIEIRGLAGTASHRELARRFGVTHRAIGMILSGKRWGHLIES